MHNIFVRVTHNQGGNWLRWQLSNSVLVAPHPSPPSGGIVTVTAVGVSPPPTVSTLDESLRVLPIQAVFGCQTE